MIQVMIVASSNSLRQQNQCHPMVVGFFFWFGSFILNVRQSLFSFANLFLFSPLFSFSPAFNYRE